MTSYGFHPAALVEYEDATRYYLEQASPIVAAAFVAAVESAIQAVLASPMTWRVVTDITTSTVDRYLEGQGRQFFPSCPRGRVPHKASGLRRQVEILSHQDVLRPDSERQPLIGIDRWVADFDQYLDQVVGNALSTRKNYVRYACRFLMECFDAEEPNWPTLQADQITKFVRREAAKLQPSGCRQKLVGRFGQALTRTTCAVELLTHRDL